MDKYEYGLKLDQLKVLCSEAKYEEAAELADSISWNKIKNVNALVKVGEIYEKVGRYEDSREILLNAYDRSPIGRTIIYRLAEVAIKMEDFEGAQEYYDEFVDIAPHDNQRYVLKYNIMKAQKAPYTALIPVLEELKEQEYTEEWAYELAFLYHKTGAVDKCIDACDELILWFGDGPYVERALELKMLYQPLNKAQEEKYRRFRHERDGKTVIGAEEMARAGEYVHEPVAIPQVTLNPSRFNTTNLQEEIAKGMQQIMEATEKETIVGTMDNIKKIVEDIPYLQLPREESVFTETAPHIETDEEIDGSLKINFQELLGEDSDGQISLVTDEKAKLEQQITGQMTIAEVLEEWEKTKRAAETALKDVEQRKLESAKARALQEAEGIMERLNDVLPKIEAGVTPRELLEEEYMQHDENDVLAAEIAAEVLLGQTASLGEDDLEAIKAAVADSKVEIPQYLVEERVAQEAAKAKLISSSEEPDMEEATVEETAVEEAVAEEAVIEEAVIEEAVIEETAVEEAVIEEAVIEESTIEEAVIEESAIEEAVIEEAVIEEAVIEETVIEETVIEEEVIEESIPVEEPIIPEVSLDEEPEIKTHEIKTHEIQKLSEEQKAIFSYFVPVKGMEPQLCNALNAVIADVEADKTSAKRLIVQGAPGCGKTVLATSIIRVLQKECGYPTGKVGKIYGEALNKKDVQQLLKKVAGGCLIIESAGNLDRKTAVTLALLLEQDTSGILIILEDTAAGIKKALANDDAFAKKFTQTITVPIFSNDDLVVFGKAYANELGYVIDEMGILALHNSITSIEKLDQATKLEEVKEIIDAAIYREAHSGLRKFIGIFTANRYTDDEKIVLTEQDFE